MKRRKKELNKQNTDTQKGTELPRFAGAAELKIARLHDEPP